MNSTESLARRRRLPTTLGLGAVLLALSSCGPTSSAPERTSAEPGGARSSLSASEIKAVDALLGALGRRLQIMHEVARWKWNAKKPIDDPQREEQLLDQLRRRGTELSLTPGETRRLMRAQIEAGKLIQRADWDRWRREEQAPFADVADLQRELRPQIDRASEELLSAFAALRDRLNERAVRKFVRNRAEEALQAQGIAGPVRAAALEGWLDGTERRDESPSKR